MSDKGDGSSNMLCIGYKYKATTWYFKRVPQWYNNLAGQQYNVGEKLTVILYTYINHHAQLPVITQHTDCSTYFQVVLFCFVFRPYAFVEAAALRSIVLRYAGVPIATRVFFFFFFFFFFFSFLSLFPSIFLCIISSFSLYGEYVVRSFLPDGIFLPCDHGLDF